MRVQFLNQLDLDYDEKMQAGDVPGAERNGYKYAPRRGEGDYHYEDKHPAGDFYSEHVFYRFS